MEKPIISSSNSPINILNPRAQHSTPQHLLGGHPPFHPKWVEYDLRIVWLSRSLLRSTKKHVTLSLKHIPSIFTTRTQPTNIWQDNKLCDIFSHWASLTMFQYEVPPMAAGGGWDHDSQRQEFGAEPHKIQVL